MGLSGIFDSFYNMATSVGLPPLALVCLIALFIFIYVFGLIILIKIRKIRKDLMTVNNSLDTIAQRIEQRIGSSQARNGGHDIDADDIKIEHRKQLLRNFGKKETKKRIHFTKINEPNESKQIKTTPGSREKKLDLFDKEYDSSDIKNKIIKLLKETSRPTSYHEIAESLSQDSN